jgi:cell division protein FtsN
MNIRFQDPAFLIPIGIIILGVILLLWAIGKLFKKAPSAEEFAVQDSLLPPAGNNELFGDMTPPAPVAVRPPTPIREKETGPAVNKEMVDRLDTMAQRLSDMQTVLQRQAGAVPAGSPLTPETIDKLLKIIGNVTQQVDALQRSLGVTPTTPAPAATPAAAPTIPQAASPAASPAAPGVPPATGGGKPIGIAGGALSGLGRKPTTPPPGTPPAK